MWLPILGRKSIYYHNREGLEEEGSPGLVLN